MTKNTPHFVYQQPAIDFLTVAAQCCLSMEHVREQEKTAFVGSMLQLLPILYVRARAIERPQPELDGMIERYVTEQAYEQVRTGVADLLAGDDAYLDVFVQDFRYEDEPVTAYISENLADIYQELKDLAANYQSENESVINDALLACLEAFDEHWGQKIVNVLRPLHILSLDNHYEGE